MAAGVVDWVLRSADVPTRAARATRTVLNGVWLGVLSDDRLRELDERYHAREGRYRDDEWNGRGLFPWEAALVDDHVPPGTRVAVVGAGGGREVLALRGRGVDAVGYESHPALAAYGEAFLAERGHPGCLHVAPRDGFPADAPTFDIVLLGWGLYSLVHSRSARVALLRSCRAPVVLLSCFERPAAFAEARRTAAIANVLRRVRRAPGLEEGDMLAPNRVHVFSDEQLRDEARAAGYTVAEHRTFEAIEAGTSYAAAVLRAS